MAALCLALVGCTPASAPPPPRPVVVPRTSASATAEQAEAPPPPKPELPACEIERQGLAERANALRFSPECLPLLETTGDLRFVKKLSLVVYGPTEAADLSPLERLVALEEVTLRLDPMPKLDALAKLPSLKAVWILSRLQSFDPLRSLARIEKLSIEPPSYDAIADVDALAGLRSLRTLTLRAEIDLAALAQALPKLHVLVVPGATHLDALASFTELEHVSLSCFESDSVRYPAPPKLVSLAIECHDAPSPLGPVVSFPNLTTLDISETGSTSLSPVGKLKKLERLDAHASQVKNLAPLAGCRELTWLDIHDAPVTSLSPLGQLPHLSFIDAGNTPIRSLAPLAGSKSLESLWLPGSRVSSVAALTRVPSLKEVMVPRGCDSRDVIGLHRALPALRIMAWVEKSRSEDPTCF